MSYPLSVRAFGKTLDSPIGFAAGVAKTLPTFNYSHKYDVGFLEMGTYSSEPMKGNPGGSVYPDGFHRNVFNDIGLKNKGRDGARSDLEAVDSIASTFSMAVGLNWLLEKDDIEKSLLSTVDYVTLNLSCPNIEYATEELNFRRIKKINSVKPVYLKIAPEWTRTKPMLVKRILKKKRFYTGLIVSNSRSIETGAVSGKSLFEISTNALSEIYKLSSGKIHLIGCGGVLDGETAWEKIISGASLVQVCSLCHLYPKTYHSRLRDINRDLKKKLEESSLESISQAVGLKFREKST